MGNRWCYRVCWLICFSTLFTVPTRAQWLTAERELMGTRVSVELWSKDEKAGQRAIDLVFNEIERLDQMMNPWNPASELARINRNAGSGALTTTAELVAVIERSLHYSRLSGGAFDVSFASVAQHYDYREGKAPTGQLVEKAKKDIDYRAIQLDSYKRQIRFVRPGLQLDLGGIAKGYAVDRGIDLLRAEGIQAAVVTAGGDSRILGDMGDRPRTVGIRHPRKEGEFVVMIPLADTAISTSGDYERFFIKDGVRYHHILDPKNGRSASAVQSVTILAGNAMDTDALSTTVFVLGVQPGLNLVNSLDGVEAIIIDAAGKLHYSKELLLSTQP